MAIGWRALLEGHRRNHLGISLDFTHVLKSVAEVASHCRLVLPEHARGHQHPLLIMLIQEQCPCSSITDRK